MRLVKTQDVLRSSIWMTWRCYFLSLSKILSEHTDFLSELKANIDDAMACGVLHHKFGGASMHVYIKCIHYTLYIKCIHYMYIYI